MLSHAQSVLRVAPGSISPSLQSFLLKLSSQTTSNLRRHSFLSPKPSASNKNHLGGGLKRVSEALGQRANPAQKPSSTSAINSNSRTRDGSFPLDRLEPGSPLRCNRAKQSSCGYVLILVLVPLLSSTFCRQNWTHSLNIRYILNIYNIYESQALAPVFRRSSAHARTSILNVRQICAHACLSPFNSGNKTRLSFTGRKWKHRPLPHPRAFVLAFLRDLNEEFVITGELKCVSEPDSGGALQTHLSDAVQSCIRKV